MVIPASLPDAQQLLLATKDQDGKLAITEVLPVRFSRLEGCDSYAPEVMFGDGVAIVA